MKKSSRFLGVVALSFVLSGCVESEDARLATGRECLAADRDVMPAGFERGAIPLMFPDPPLPDSPGPGAVAVGTRVLVVADDDRGDDNPARAVTVKVLDGDLGGRSGRMMRWSLRPVR